ncbi:hypothetical protein MNBD_GAMMA26-2102 [hydrothermal vent metagenome]|uniref:Cation/H+ exchanger transmembrane domain-containing protein n=1 Tax=hydrothermal vent metagenome TaxID=652676 RepID=A0A3B1AH40_9ZZZZ
MPSDYPLLITLGLLLILTPLIKSLLSRFAIPPLVGYILLGFLLRLLDQQWPFIDTLFDNTFTVLAHIGVVALLFRVGLRSHIQTLIAKLPDASLIWVGDVLVNLVFGYIVARYALSLSVETAMVIATAFSATSVAVSVAVWQDAGKLGSPQGQLLVDVAELDDLSGIVLLAILLAILPVFQEDGATILPLVGAATGEVLIKLALFIAGCYLFSHYLEARFTRFSRKQEGSNTALTISILGAGLAIAAVAGSLGFSLAIGALFAGLAFSRDKKAVHSDAGFSYFYELFTPFFFINIGLQVDPAALLESLGLGLLLFVVAVLGKLIGAGGPALLTLSRRDAALLGISMVPRAEIALVIISQCRQIGEGIVSNQIFAAMVLVSIATSISSSLVLHGMLGKKSEKKTKT